MLPDLIETTNLALRPFSSADANAVFDYWRSDPNWEKFNASVPVDFSIDDAVDFTTKMCQRDREISPHWAIVHDARVCGVVSLNFEQDKRVCVLGYGIHKELQGRGFTIEACRAVIDLAFPNYGELQRFRAHTDAENEASIKVLLRLGFRLEGTLRKNQFVKGHLRDEAIFGLLRSDWNELRDKLLERQERELI